MVCKIKNFIPKNRDEVQITPRFHPNYKEKSLSLCGLITGTTRHALITAALRRRYVPQFLTKIRFQPTADSLFFGGVKGTFPSSTIYHYGIMIPFHRKKVKEIIFNKISSIL
jgi:hypothetical protein